MGDEPNYEGAVTAGMHALADEIMRGLDTTLFSTLMGLLRRMAALVRRPPAEPSEPDR
jgi:hypothetical protein